MSALHSLKFALALSALALAATASAGPPGHGGGHVGPAHVGPAHIGPTHVGPAHGGSYHGPIYAAQPIVRVYGGIGYGYSQPFGYGYGPGFFPTFGSPYSTFGPNYGVVGGYGTLGVRIGGSGYAPVIGSTVVPSLGPAIPNGPTIIPAPLPPSGAGELAPATIVVLTKEGAAVSFDGVDSPVGGARHSFTTKPLPTNAETRVAVSLNGGATTLSLRVRGGESATVDLR